MIDKFWQPNRIRFKIKNGADRCFACVKWKQMGWFWFKLSFLLFTIFFSRQFNKKQNVRKIKKRVEKWKNSHFFFLFVSADVTQLDGQDHGSLDILHRYTQLWDQRLELRDHITFSLTSPHHHTTPLLEQVMTFFITPKSKVTPAAFC